MIRYLNKKMTRVFIFLGIFTLAISIETEEGWRIKSLGEALDDFMPFQPNFTEIDKIISEEISKNDPEFQSQYAELLLLGLPISSDSFPTSNSTYTEHNQFKRNLDLSLYYLKKTLSTSKNSAFLTNIFLKSSLLIEGFDQYVPFSGLTSSTFRSLQEKSLLQQSPGGIIHLVDQYQECRSMPSAPSFLQKSEISRLTFQPADICSLRCEDVGYLALSAATSSMEYSQRSKKDYIKLPVLGKDDSWTATRLQSTLKMLEKSATVKSQNLNTVAEYYIQGQRIIGMKPDLDTGLGLLEKSAGSGNVKAHEELGALYYEGRYVGRNMTKALFHLNSALRKGSALAQAVLGKIYLYGIEEQFDEERGMKLLLDSIKAGEPLGYSILGEYFFLKKNWAEALWYLHVAVTMGSESSKYYYGIVLLNSTRQENCENAVDLFKELTLAGILRKYAENGYLMYNNGDFEGAFLNFLVSAQLGEEYSRLALAYMFENNQVPERFRCKKGKEFCAAWFYFLAGGTSKNLLKLGKIVASGNEFFNRSYEEAKEIFLQAADLPESLFELAKIYHYGLGVEPDDMEAEKYLNSILDKAEGNLVDKDAKYPALLMKSWFRVSRFVEWALKKVYDIIELL